MADFGLEENHIGSSIDDSNSNVLKSSKTTMKQRVTTSPEASSTASESPTPTNSVHEKNWSTHWHSLVSEEQRELLGTEEESSDRQSDGESDSVWEISAEQRDYYRTQFTQLQPDANGLLPGSTARAFFEKSKLSLAELRKIWQLSDVTRDGALSLDEFMVAMHLVVLRRNNIMIPDKLPPPLAPHSPVSIVSSASPHHGKQWTKFVESPTSSISSPGPKPVNFDFHKSAVEQDPKILHPVAVRVTPNNMEMDEQHGSSDVSPIRPIQRPQPKKHSVPGPGAIPPPPPQTSTDDNQVLSSTKKDPPPPPPPRPYKQHTRSSSLDLTRLGRTGGVLNMPPVPPPRTSPGTVSPKKQNLVNLGQGDDSSMSFANFAQFPDESSGLTMGAFHVYRKPSNAGEKSDEWTPIDDIPLDACMEAREAHNAVLRKICHQLQSTLASLQEERASLQNILDHLLCID